jgi:hypothetical protein
MMYLDFLENIFDFVVFRLMHFLLCEKRKIYENTSIQVV